MGRYNIRCLPLHKFNYATKLTAIFDLATISHYTGRKDLLDFSCKIIAEVIKGKTSEEIEKEFNIKVEFTKEEQEENKEKFIMRWLELGLFRQ